MGVTRARVGAALGWALLAAAAHAQEPEGDDPAHQVGDAACRGCHAAATEAYARTLHARVLRPGGDYARAAAGGCESCHGPGSAHVSAAGRPERHDVLTFRAEDAVVIERENEACLACHAGGGRRYWRTGIHAAHDLACTSCHTTKRDVSPRFQLTRATETETCAQCHLVERSQAFRNAHMANREGKLECSACHQSHGSAADAMLTHASVNDTCYACHAEKRGPFLWEHAPATEDCLSCHAAHGSVRAGMLKLSQPRLCQQCHLETLHPSEARLPQSRFVIGGACLQCHPQVHGSNHPSGFALTR